MTRLPGISPELYPFNNRFLKLESGHRVHLVDEGPRDGQPVVMVHGNPTWSFYYRELIKGLREDFRCIAPDHVGMGLSDRPGDEAYHYTLKSRIEDLGQVIDRGAPERPVDLVVHDWGGPIGLGWAVAHPERVRRLVLLNTWAFPIPADAELPRSLAFARSPVGAFMVKYLNAFSALAVRMCCEKKLSASEARGLLAPYQGSPKRRLAVLRFVQDIPLRPEDPAWPVLEEISANLGRLADKPILIGWGGKDFVFTDRVLERWRQIFPDAEVEYVEDAGHYVMEDADERLVPRIREFLTAKN